MSQLVKNRAAMAKLREKQAREVQAALLTPTVEKVEEMASKLSDEDLAKALGVLAEKVGLEAAIKQIYASLTPVQRLIPDVPRAVPGPTAEAQPLSLALPVKTFPDCLESRLCTVYARPCNQRQRLVEFKDKSHGTLWVHLDSPVWTGWTVWVKKNPNAQQGGYILDGTYSRRGIRLK